MVNPKKKWERDENINKLRILIKKAKEITFSKMQEKMDVSEPTLTKYIKQLERDKEIEVFSKPDDRRKKWYRIKSEDKVDLAIGKYEAIDFIEKIPSPIYKHKKVGNSSVSAFVGPVTSNLQRKAASLFMKSIFTLATMELNKRRDILNILSPSQEIAVIFTVKG
jgi:DNA-binding PadR family transcriptional regulator